MSRRADIVIIGGGIAGVGAAARLSPDATVIVLEQEAAIGYHATGRSGALFILNYGNATLRALNAASLPVFRDPGDLCDGPLLSPRGELMLADEDGDDALDTLLADAEDMERLTPDEALEIVPILRRDRIVAAAIERDASDIDVERLLQGYARMLRRNGGEIVLGATAQAIELDQVWRVTTPRGTFESPVLVNAAGGWADGVAGMAGLRPRGLTPLRRSAVIAPEPPVKGAGDWPLFGSVLETWYVKPQSGKLMISPADEDPVEPHDVWAEDLVLAEGIDRMQQMVDLPVERIERSWAGMRTFAPDRTPVIGFDPESEGFFWLAGQGGYGIQTSPALARLSADLIVGRVPEFGADLLARLSPARL